MLEEKDQRYKITRTYQTDDGKWYADAECVTEYQFGYTCFKKKLEEGDLVNGKGVKVKS